MSESHFFSGMKHKQPTCLLIVKSADKVERFEIFEDTQVNVQAGCEYLVLNKNIDMGEVADIESFIVAVKEDDVHVQYANGVTLTFFDFFSESYGAFITLPSAFASDYTLNSWDVPMGVELDYGLYLIYAYGEKELLFGMIGDKDVWETFDQHVDFYSDHMSLIPFDGERFSDNQVEKGVFADDFSFKFFGGTNVTTSLLGVGGFLGLLGSWVAWGGSEDHSNKVKGKFVWGPVVPNHGLSLMMYGQAGEILAAGVKLDYSGEFQVTLRSSYEGAVLLEVSDASLGPDYIDEGTGEAKDFEMTARSIGYIDTESTSFTMNVTNLTEMAVRQLGIPLSQGGLVEPIGDLLGENIQEKISTANKNIGKAMGLGDIDILSTPIIPLIDADGNEVSEVNQYGKVLAGISAMENEKGLTSEEVLTYLQNNLKEDVLDTSVYEELRDIAASDLGIDLERPQESLDMIDISEHIADQAIIYSANSLAEDSNVTYTLAGKDAAFFQIDEDGFLRFIEVPNFAEKQNYELEIELLYEDGQRLIRVLDININDLEEVDLSDSEEGAQRMITHQVNKASIFEGVSFCSTLQAPSLMDIKKVEIVFSGEGLDTATDQISVDTLLSMEMNKVMDNVQVGDTEGVDYIYSSVDRSLTFSKNDGEVFSGEEIKSLVEAVKLRNISGEVKSGERIASITYLGESDYRGITSLSTLEVHAESPKVLEISDSVDFEMAYGPITYTLIFSHSVGTSFTAEDIMLVDMDQNDLDRSKWVVDNVISEDGVTWTFQVSPPEGSDAVEAFPVGIKIEKRDVIDLYGNYNEEYSQSSDFQYFDTKNLLFFVGGDTKEVSVVENAPVQEALYDPQVYGKSTDQTNSNIVYALGGEDVESFAIDASSGELFLKEISDYEQKTFYELILTARDDQSTQITQDIRINVVNEDDEGPMFESVENLTVRENLPIDKIVHDFQAFDNFGEYDEDITYFLDAIDLEVFTIDPEKGYLFFNQSPDYEEKKRYKFNVFAEDGEGLELINNYELDVLNEVEIDSLSTVVEAEDLPMGDGVKDNRLLITFADAVSVSELTLEKIVPVGPSKTFGDSATLEALNIQGNYSDTFRIVLGENANIIEGDTFEIQKEFLELDTGEFPTENLVLEVPDISSPMMQSLRVYDADEDTLYSRGDQLIFSASEYLKTEDLSLSDFILDSNTWGVDAEFKTLNAKEIGGALYAKEFMIELAYSATVDASNTVTLEKSQIEDLNGNKASSNFIYDLPNLARPMAAAFDPIVALDSDADGIKDDGFLLQFSEPVKVSSITMASLSVTNARSFGDSPAIVPLDEVSGYAEKFSITLGSGATVRMGDHIIVSMADVENSNASKAETDISFLVPSTRESRETLLLTKEAQSTTNPLLEGYVDQYAKVEVRFTFDTVTYEYVTQAQKNGYWSIDLGSSDINGQMPSFQDQDFFECEINSENLEGDMAEQVTARINIDLTNPMYVTNKVNINEGKISIFFNEEVRVVEGVDLLEKVSMRDENGEEIFEEDILSIEIPSTDPKKIIINLSEQVDWTSKIFVNIEHASLENISGLNLEAINDLQIMTDVPVVTKSSLRVNKGETVEVTDQMIGVSDVDIAPSALRFKVDEIEGGTFKVRGVISKEFTHEDLLTGEVTFQHYGEDILPKFKISVSDGDVFEDLYESDMPRFGKLPLTSLVARWDAQNVLGIGDDTSLINGVSILEWKDVSGSEYMHDAYQSNDIYAPIYNQEGMNGYPSLSFSPSKMLEIDNHQDINTLEAGYDQRSFAFVFKSGTNNGGKQVLYEQGSVHSGYALNIMEDGKLYAGAWNANDWHDDHKYKTFAIAEIEDNTFYTVGFVHDARGESDENKTLKIYLNGELVGELENVSIQGKDEGHIGLGGMNVNTIDLSNQNSLIGGYDHFFKGDIGEVLVWNTTLSDQDMKDFASYSFNKWATTMPSYLDLNGDGSAGQDLFVSGKANELIPITTENAYVSDVDTIRYNNLQIDIKGLIVEENDFLVFRGMELSLTPGARTSFSLNGGQKVLASVMQQEETYQVTLTDLAGGTLLEDAMVELLSGLLYKNMSEDALMGKKTFIFVTQDSDGVKSNFATSEVSFSGYIWGTPESDILEGSSGDDVLIGGAAMDDLTGNGGADTFVYKDVNDGNDIIRDFLIKTISSEESDLDKIDISEVLDYVEGDNLSEFCQTGVLDQDLLLYIDADGGNDFLEPDIVITLLGAGENPIALDDMLGNGQLVVL
ncbi:hypothetical protein AB834_06695 [PVC group bacterium (ex Bugula neritina AB1)]|nr:hypothetical protein AB834_06695 [PVC group bacterium (ex Bugula neritina AB1)]